MEAPGTRYTKSGDVHIAYQVFGDGGLVSSTVRDLVAGSGIAFHDRGSQALKGVPEEWRPFSVVEA